MKEQITKILDSVIDTEISIHQGIVCLKEIKERNPGMFVESMREVTGNEYKEVMLKIAKQLVSGTSSTGPR